MAENSTPVLDRLWSLLSAPSFADPERTRIAGLLNVILLVVVVLIVVFSGGVLIVGQTDLAGLAVEGVILMMAIGLLILMRWGRVFLAALLLSSALWVLITAGIWAGGGLHGAGVSSYFGIILIAGLLLGGWAGIAFGILSVAAGAAMLYAETQGLLPAIPRYVTSTYLWFDFAVTVVGVTGLLFLATRSLRSAVDQARHNERQLAQTNRELNATRISLEEHNRELRTTVQRYVDYMAIVGRGDLSTRLAVDPGDDADDALVLLGCSLNDTVASLGHMISEIRDASASLGSAAAEILAASMQQVAGASQQSAAIVQTSATVDTVRAIADQAVARAQDVAGAAQRTVEVSHSGQQTVDKTVLSMSEIKEQVEGIASHILMLSRHTQQIGDIISTVSDLASQSNMLALNAAVEAARAGEHGKGFAVVASEVRSLAEQSRQATARVKAILQDIQKATNLTVMATEEGTKRVDAGVELAAQTGDAIRQLSRTIGESAQAALQMVAGGRQQATGIDQIALAMQSIHQATIQSLASTRQAERSAQDLNDLAQRLADTVALYRV